MAGRRVRFIAETIVGKRVEHRRVSQQSRRHVDSSRRETIIKSVIEQLFGLGPRSTNRGSWQIGGRGVGAGGTASRLVHGNYALYDELEQQLAEWKEREAALVFANGYQANTGVIAALAGRGDAVFSDRLNHASIVDGIVLSRAEHFRYRHNDMEHLEFLLKKHPDARRKWIVTDSIFSMDGDKAPLLELVKLRDRYDTMLMVDEAHAGECAVKKGRACATSSASADKSMF